MQFTFKQIKGKKKAKSWRSKEDNDKVFAYKVIKEVDLEMTSNAEIIQTKMKTCVIQIAKEILGESDVVLW